MLFLKKNSLLTSESLSAITWKRFKRNKPAMIGLFLIIMACVISVLGYLITPDSTPYANSQHPELHIKSPGFRINHLRVAKNKLVEESNLFSTLLFGREENYTALPFYSYKFSGAEFVLEEFTGNEPNNGSETRYNLADVVYSLQSETKPIFDSVSNSIRFVDGKSNKELTLSISALQKVVLEKHIETKTYLLGTDLLGRDLLSRLLIGTRISLTVGLISVVISIFIGVLLGAAAGYYRGSVDAVISWLINVVWSIPTLLLVIAITLVLGKGVTQVFIAVGLTMWVDVARIVRGQVLSLREKEFVEAGRALGYSNARIIIKHILPNVTGPVIVMAAGNFVAAILTEAGLSFLGIGAQPPVPSWGEMTNAHRGYILMDKAYLAFIPGLAIMTLVLAFMMVGNGLRDALDTKLSDSKAI